MGKRVGRNADLLPAVACEFLPFLFGFSERIGSHDPGSAPAKVVDMLDPR